MGVSVYFFWFISKHADLNENIFLFNLITLKNSILRETIASFFLIKFNFKLFKIITKMNNN